MDEVSPGRGSLLTTGSLGDVMKESVAIAYTVAKRELAAVQPHSAFFHHTRIHLHLPSGSTPKDGPSAGITYVIALLSLALSRPTVPHLAMTGELSLTGRVLPIGGLKEKFLACQRSGVKTVIVPEDNRKDVEELADFIREGVEVRYAATIHQVVEWSFGGLEALREARGEEVEEAEAVEIRSIDCVEEKRKEEGTKKGRADRKRRQPPGKGRNVDVPIQEPPPPSAPTPHPTSPIVL